MLLDPFLSYRVPSTTAVKKPIAVNHRMVVEDLKLLDRERWGKGDSARDPGSNSRRHPSELGF